MLATSVVALFLLAAIPSTYAFGGFGGPRGGGQGFNSENREAIEAAIESEDYDAFVEATGNSNITETQFEEMLERHAEMETRRTEMEAEREAIQNAIEAGDYATWASLVAEQNPDAPILEKITADNFSQLREMQQLREQIRGIQDELGVGQFGFGPGGGVSDCGGFGGHRGGGHRGFGQGQE